MTGPTGATQEGRVSARSLENTGPRKFLVIEADFTAWLRANIDALPVARAEVEEILKRRQ
jgi:hypothetical protein